jgi:hypothetical protein
MVLPANHHTTNEFDPHLKIFHEPRQIKVSEILLVSTLYDDGRNPGSVIICNGHIGNRMLGESS